MMFNGSTGVNGLRGFGADPAHIQQTFNALAKTIAAQRKKNLSPAEMSALSQAVNHAYAEVASRNRGSGAPLSQAQEDDGARAILRTVAARYGVRI